MKQLYVVRHAKSSWSDGNLQDIDRPLKGRGIRDATGTSEWLQENNYLPEHIISSPATRALHTAMIFARNFGIDFSTIAIKAELYHGQPENYWQVAREIDDRYDAAMVFGHNPGLADFINQASDQRVGHVPTTGVACLAFSVERWKDINNKAKLLFFDYPKKRIN
ncbi:MAG: histidine phosphatase family protein [Cryomorphaceae bacterium]|nr:histidine phosphatase family protein [Cryomorphaceae bacterium]